MITFVEKKELIIVTILTFLIAITGLFATYAIDTKLGYNDTTQYDMSLSFDLSNSTNKQVSIPAGKTKFFDIDVKNSNSGTIKYGIAYSMVSPTSLPSGVLVGQSSKSANPSQGLINANATIPVTIAVENTSSTDITISLSIIYGYEKGGALGVPSGKTLIKGKYNPNKITTTNLIKDVTNNQIETFFTSELPSSSIESIEFVKFEEVPSGVGTSIDISLNEDNTVLLYYKQNPNTSLNNVYIATNDGKVKISRDAYGMFYGVSKVTTLDLSNVVTTDVTNMQNMFYGMSSLTSLNISNFDTSKVTTMKNMFMGLSNLTSLDLSSFDTSNVINMESMFENTSSLTSLDLSSFDTSNVTSMVRMFYNMSSLTSLDVSNFNTSNVTRMSRMFMYVSSLTSLDISNFDTSKVTTMDSMFESMSSLTSLDVSNFNTSNVTSMSSMFCNMSSVTSLDVSNFDTSKVTGMYMMFGEMRGITSLDLSNFDTSNVTSMGSMFSNMTKLKTIYASDKFNTSKVTSSNNMFYWCTSLVGGNGTAVVNSSYIDKTYARIDTSSTPGYFTKK